MKSFIALLFSSLIISTSSFAESHDHDDHEHFPEGTLIAFEGIDAVSRQECALYVTDIQQQADGAFIYTALTSYSHDEDSAGAFQIQVSPSKKDLLLGTADSGNPKAPHQLGIILKQPTGNIADAQSFNLRWLHGNHYHTNKCINLVVHED